MGYTHYDKLSGVNGISVGKKGHEVKVADSAGNLYQSGAALAGTADEISRGRIKKVSGNLAAVDTDGGIFSWKNPEAGDILIEHVALKVTTKTTDACTVDVGTTDIGATTSSDTLIDGVDVHTATGVFTNDESAGTSGKVRKRLKAGKWVTGSKASGASAGLKGAYEIYYIVL
ncbi:MAG: hypothetical protein WC096_03625 [Sphaerochaetaceae bacterium]